MLKIPTKTLSLSQIQPPTQPLRITIDDGAITELAESIKEHGLLHPILVRRIDSGHEIVAGHRRFLAIQRLGWKEIEARVLARDVPEPELLSLAENVHRENLTPVEEARLVYHQVVTLGRDVDIAARRFGKKRAWIDQRLALMDYPQDLKDALHSRTISLAVAKELHRVTDEGYRTFLVKQVDLNGATAQTARIWADDWTRASQAADQPLTATQGGRPEYAGQTTGLTCSGCATLLPIANLRPLYFCASCIYDIHQAKSQAAAPNAGR